MKIITINSPTVFSFQECLKFLSRSENECLFAVENDKIRKLFILEQTPILIEIYSKNKENLELNFLNMIPSETQAPTIKNYIENWLDLNHDIRPFYTLAKKDEILAPLVEKYHGLKLIGIPDFYEAICWAIIGQQINLSFAYAVKRNLVENYGKQFEFEGRKYFHFPSPEKVLSINNQEFLAMKFSKQKAAYIRAISDKIINQGMDSSYFKKLDYETAKAALLTFHGIGNWTADYVLMKTFKHPQAFPIQDVGLQNAIKKRLGLQIKPDLETISKLSQAWKGHESYATFYLWRSLYD